MSPTSDADEGALTARVPTELDGRRADEAVSRTFSGFSRKEVKALFDAGRVRVDGLRIKKGDRVAAGAALSVDAPSVAIAPDASIPLAVLFESRDFVIVDGLRGPGRFVGCVVGVRVLDGGQWYGEGEVKVYLDGVPQTLPDGQSQLTNVEFASLERIEVLRGASSSLYGNASGGALKDNPIMATGLCRIGNAADHIFGGGNRALAHSTSGPCLQQNLICILEASNKDDRS